MFTRYRPREPKSSETLRPSWMRVMAVASSGATDSVTIFFE